MRPSNATLRIPRPATGQSGLSIAGAAPTALLRQKQHIAGAGALLLRGFGLRAARGWVNEIPPHMDKGFMLPARSRMLALAVRAVLTLRTGPCVAPVLGLLPARAQ
jgi:hypothetical protein